MTTQPAARPTPATGEDAEPRVERNDDEGRYEIHVGDVLAGFTEFAPDSHGRLVFPHTEIDPAFKGQGLGGILVGQALADVASRGETVVPHCPFVVRYLRRHEVPGLDIDWPNAARTSCDDQTGRRRRGRRRGEHRVRRTARAAARVARGAARRRPRDVGAPLASAARPAARRRVVLPRPVRTAGHAHAGGAASAHRTADGHLAVRRRHPPPRHGRQRRRRAAAARSTS